MPKNLEVVVVDPDVNSRADTNRALTMARFTVSGEAGYGIDAVTMAKEKNPDVIVLAMEEPVARAVSDHELHWQTRCRKRRSSSTPASRCRLLCAAPWSPAPAITWSSRRGRKSSPARSTACWSRKSAAVRA